MAFRTNKTPVLQEKTASGSVVSFNTALAMPLASCNIAVNAWQEGSGDPSPVNNRPIHGFSEVNPTVGSGNLYNGTFGGYNELSLKAGKQLILQGDMSNDVYLVLRVYDENKTFLQSSTTTTGTGTGTRYGVVTLNSDISYYRIERSSQSGVYNNIMLSLGTTVKPYTPYVTPTIYTIQLGQEVYGAEVDVVNGVAHVTHGYAVLDGSDDENWEPNLPLVAFNLYFADMKTGSYLSGLCDKFKTVNNTASTGIRFGLDTSKRITVMRLSDYLPEFTVEAWRTWLATNNITVVYPLAVPFDIQLTPTQIETIRGNNTIFADTGDVDLTFNDLDIAKRGNFREVFKLPS